MCVAVTVCELKLFAIVREKRQDCKEVGRKKKVFACDGNYCIVVENLMCYMSPFHFIHWAIKRLKRFFYSVLLPLLLLRFSILFIYICNRTCECAYIKRH